jgi:hypothetical protein
MSHSFDNHGNGAPLEDAGVFVPILSEARLLVVDDEESLRITTAAIFEKEGYSSIPRRVVTKPSLYSARLTTIWCSLTFTWKVATVFQFSIRSGVMRR